MYLFRPYQEPEYIVIGAGLAFTSFHFKVNSEEQVTTSTDMEINALKLL
jgi:hypothetical protein